MAGLYLQGIWSWFTLALVFGILPVVELFTTQSTQNVAESEEADRSKRLLFDVLLYLNAPLLFVITGWYLYTIAFQTPSWLEVIGLTLGTGIVVGANGIN
ncbi:MAG TPA: alkane 1-monooxygenase, partial [Saprospirales bacterium]|nr:alkane 1-monooxygenase [Saprospirales bacterium]